MTEHTPGPWIAEPSDNDGPSIWAEDSWLIAVCPNTPGAEANARLIAVAPRMLKALEWLLHLNHGVSAAGDGRPVSNDEWEAAFEFAQEVFAAAKGEHNG